MFAPIALNRCLHQRRVDDLSAPGQVTMLMQLLLYLVEHKRADSGLGQSVARQPDGFGVGDAAALGQVEELQEAAPVEQLIFQRVVGQVVKLLMRQDLDHQHRQIRRMATFGMRCPRRGVVDTCGECFAVCMVGQADQRAPIELRRVSRSSSANRLIQGSSPWYSSVAG